MQTADSQVPTFTFTLKITFETFGSDATRVKGVTLQLALAITGKHLLRPADSTASPMSLC